MQFSSQTLLSHTQGINASVQILYSILFISIGMIPLIIGYSSITHDCTVHSSSTVQHNGDKTTVQYNTIQLLYVRQINKCIIYIHIQYTVYYFVKQIKGVCLVVPWHYGGTVYTVDSIQSIPRNRRLCFLAQFGGITSPPICQVTGRTYSTHPYVRSM